MLNRDEEMNKNELIDKWINESLEYIEDAISKIESIKISGQKEAKRGLAKIRQSDHLLIYMHYLKRMLSGQKDKFQMKDPIITASLVDLNHQLFNLKSDVGNIAFGIENSQYIAEFWDSQFLMPYGSTDSTAYTSVYLGANIEKRLQSQFPDETPAIIDTEPDILPSRDEILSELIDLLKPIDEKYVSMVEGSEASLFSNKKDSLSQAAHSMRDCFQEVIEELAPTKVVLEQPWFEPTPEAPQKVSRRSRIRYILYGTGENYENSIVQRLDELAGIAKNSLDICTGKAHDHDLDNTQQITSLAIDHARINLITILKYHNDKMGQ